MSNNHDPKLSTAQDTITSWRTIEKSINFRMPAVFSHLRLATDNTLTATKMSFSPREHGHGAPSALSTIFPSTEDGLQRFWRDYHRAVNTLVDNRFILSKIANDDANLARLQFLGFNLTCPMPSTLYTAEAKAAEAAIAPAELFFKKASAAIIRKRTLQAAREGSTVTASAGVQMSGSAASSNNDEPAPKRTKNQHTCGVR